MIGIISIHILCLGIAVAFLALDYIGKRISAKIAKRNAERNGTDKTSRGYFFKGGEKYLLSDSIRVYLHFLKVHPRYFSDVKKGIKNFEVRFNDRDYHVGDYLCLQEYANGEYTGRELRKQICYVLDSDKYCKKGFVILGME